MGDVERGQRGSEKVPYKEQTPLVEIIKRLRNERILLFGLGFLSIVVPVAVAGKLNVVTAVSVIVWGVIVLVMRFVSRLPSPEQAKKGVSVEDYIKLHLHERVRIRLRSGENIEGRLLDFVPCVAKIQTDKGEREVEPATMTNVEPL